MRWDHLRLTGEPDTATDTTPGPVPLIQRGAVTRTFDTPAFAGMTFYEIHARTLINKVPAASRVPFTRTINPYRGCSHACVYCFARNTHTYLDLDAGADFDNRVIVKVNAPELAHRELTAPTWRGDPIALGTNVDCYQRAEGRYRLMPGILRALTDTANPFSILTKGSLILRDLPLLLQAAERTTVTTAVSIGSTDPDLWRLAEPGTPSPRTRLHVCATLNDAGIPCAVLMGPVLPYLTDSPRHLADTVRQAADAGATSITAIVLHLRPGAREWYLAWLQRHHPELIAPYQRLYARGAYAPKAYQERITRQVRDLARRHGIDPHPRHRGPTPAPPPPGPQQLSLLG
ncbi:Rv2578c family radical SAM protein [Thermomonospora umbrina]|uniref:DNA repair photolyase n=1 Tax=Thermomonospora umbrina TaxID=111806 RepID=A0A3D9T576_9ACTN|nr:Rv2578c family radical SAM protein [Thermomonospora umbrina]REF00396.1 DNA repair photolyase [Thermomonospora umbrina]